MFSKFYLMVSLSVYLIDDIYCIRYEAGKSYSSQQAFNAYCGTNVLLEILLRKIM